MQRRIWRRPRDLAANAKLIISLCGFTTAAFSLGAQNLITDSFPKHRSRIMIIWLFASRRVFDTFTHFYMGAAQKTLPLCSSGVNFVKQGEFGVNFWPGRRLFALRNSLATGKKSFAEFLLRCLGVFCWHAKTFQG